MTTAKQVDANRRNALGSTGPRTAEGKAVSKLNGMRHGLLAQSVLLPDEDPDVFDELYDNLMAELAPIGEIEVRLTDRIAACLWRLQRVGAIEAGIFIVRGGYFEEALRSARYLNELSAMERHTLASAMHMDTSDLLAPELDKIEEVANPVKRRLRVLGHGYVEDVQRGDTLSKLSRYEAAIERSMYRALDELQKQQQARESGDAAAPVVIEGNEVAAVVDDEDDNWPFFD
jgi:hypothetical protein